MGSSIRYKLSELYRYGHLARSQFKTAYGYIYALPKDKDKIIDKLQKVVPPYVRNAVQVLLSARKIFTLNSLVEQTNGDYETLEYYLDRVFSKQLNWIKWGYHKSFKIYWNAKFTKEELLDDFLKELSKTYERIKIEGDRFEKEVERFLDDYLLNLPIKVVKVSSGVKDRTYFFDVAYDIFLFDEIKPIKLKVEIKSYLPSVMQVAYFYRKTREFTHGSVIPVIIAPAFPSAVYKTFGDIVYLVPYNKLKEFASSLVKVPL